MSGTVTYFSFENRLDNTGSTAGTALSSTYFNTWVTNPLGGPAIRLPGGVPSTVHTGLLASVAGISGSASRTVFMEYMHADSQTQVPLISTGAGSTLHDYTLVKEDWTHLRENHWDTDFVVDINNGFGNYVVRVVARYDGTTVKIDSRAYKVDTSNAEAVGWQTARSFSSAVALNTTDDYLYVNYWPGLGGSTGDGATAIAYFGVVGGQAWTDAQTAAFLADPTPLWTSSNLAGSSTLGSTSGLTSTPQRLMRASSTLASLSGGTAVGGRRRFGVASMPGLSGVSAAAGMLRAAASVLAVTSGLQVTPKVTLAAASTMGSTSGLSATPSGGGSIPATSSFGSTSDFQATPRATLAAASSAGSTSGFAATPRMLMQASSTLASKSNYPNNFTAKMYRRTSSAISSTSGLGATPIGIFAAASAFASSSGLTTSPQVLAAAASMLEGFSGFTSAPRVLATVQAASILAGFSGLTATPTIVRTNAAQISISFMPMAASAIGFGSEGPDEEDDMAFEVSTGTAAVPLAGDEALGLLQGGLPRRATVDQLRTRPTQDISVAGAVALTAGLVRLTAANATYAITLAAPRDVDAGRMLVLEMVARGTGNITLALTNVDGGSQPNTATFTGVGQKLVLLGGAAKWTVIRELGPTLS